MLFNSVEFSIFLPIVFFLYWFIFKKIERQNILIVFVSYFFYGWWDFRFLALILFSTIIDFLIGNYLGKTEEKSKRKILLIISLIVNLGFLGFFKYYNFFLDNFTQAFTLFGNSFEADRLHIILPVGISFYTFQTLSYTIDVYRGKLKPTKDFITFSAFVSFFPQLVAGPIERATHLLPQFCKKRYFSYEQAISGVQLIVWGLFKKVVIADNAAIIVDGIFNNYGSQSSSSLIIGAILFSFQIYGDFSGYSDIAIGTARLFGFDLMENFKFPYLSKNIGEFWKRWHISLSSWFRDYLYFPLGGSKGSLIKSIRNVFIIFLVSGFWHGANWTFIVWGFIHSVLYIPIFIYNKQSIKREKKGKSILLYFKVAFTFFATTLAWIFFRSETVIDALEYIIRISKNMEGSNLYLSTTKYKIITFTSVISIFILIIAEIISTLKNKTEVKFNKIQILLICLLIAFLGAFKNHANFIYFQF